MPKLRTNRAAAKRFKLNKSGKIKRRAAFRSHILTKKSPSRKMTLRGTKFVNKNDLKKVKSMLRLG
jgi:large subunit ribosomal protein L35